MALRERARAAREVVPAFVRWEAVNGLERIHDEETTAAVLPPLEDPAPDVRHETVLCLSRVADPPALEILVRLIDHADPQIRWRAAMGLGFARHRPAVDPLRQRLAHERVQLVRDSHLEGLRKPRVAKGRFCFF